jgi:hypothetical protein
MECRGQATVLFDGHRRSLGVDDDFALNGLAEPRERARSTCAGRRNRLARQFAGSRLRRVLSVLLDRIVPECLRPGSELDDVRSIVRTLRP